MATVSRTDVGRKRHGLMLVSCAGSISTTELHQVMKSLGQKVTAEQIQDTINEVDLDRNGSVDFDGREFSYFF